MRLRLRRRLLVVTILAIGSVGSGTARGAEPPANAAAASELELAAGATHRHPLRLAHGDFVHIVVVQHGIDVAVAILDDGGKTLAEMDTPSGDQGPEEVSWIAARDGEYYLEVTSTDSEAHAGSYDVRWEGPRASVADDMLRVRAEASSAKGHRLAAEGSADAAREGLSLLEAALPIWRGLSDGRAEAMTLYGIGQAHQSLRQGREAIARYAEALAIWQCLEDRREEASTLFALGSVEAAVGQPAQARAHLERALEIERAVGHDAMAAEVLVSLGSLDSVAGEKALAREHYAEALPMMRRARNRVGELLVLNDLGHLHEFQGEFQAAFDAYRQALEISRSLGSSRSEALVLVNLGRLYASVGDPGPATAHLTSALEIRRRLGDTGGEASALLYLGDVAREGGEPRLAIERYAAALPLFRRLENDRKTGAALNALGEARRQLGEKENARRLFEESLGLARASGDRYLEGVALTNLGRALADLGSLDEGRAVLDEAIGLRRAIGDRPGEAVALTSLARLERYRGDLTAARRHVEESLARIESVRAEVGSLALRATYLATMRESYELAVELAMEQHRREPHEGHDVAALETAERARARSFLELLGERRPGVPAGMDPALVDAERRLRDRLRGKVERQLRLAAENAPESEQARAAAEVRDAAAEHEQTLAMMRSANPPEDAGAAPRVRGLAEIRKDVLDADTVLLEYALGEERSYLWVVSEDSFSVHTLPGRGAVESAARSFLERLTGGPARGAAAGPGGPANRNLSEMLLAPAAAALGEKRLLLVPDGALHYVPFAALADPGRSGSPLVLRHEIVSLPSASVATALRQARSGRRPPSRRLAVFADPVFESADPRLPESVRRASARPSESPVPGGEIAMTRSAAAVGLPDRLPRLAFTRREARAILDLVPVKERLEALDFDVTRDAVRDATLSDYRFLHFATHGFFNARQPELSGIVLSLVDAKGQPRDGFLTATDIVDLRLPADVVVLSACRTALGKEIHGEGLVGITRAFFSAGARSVVASLWTVDDVATAELMKRFYAEMLGPDRRRPAAALRAAQASMVETRRWAAPYYWAGFLLQGEWD